MAIKEEKITIDGIEFTVKERSFKDQLEIEKLEKVNLEDIYKQSISPFEKLEQVGREDTKKLLAVYSKLNSEKSDDLDPSSEKRVED